MRLYNPQQKYGTMYVTVTNVKMSQSSKRNVAVVKKNFLKSSDFSATKTIWFLRLIIIM